MPEMRHQSLVPEQMLLLGSDEGMPPHTHPQGHLVYPATGVLSMVTSRGAWIAPPNRVVWVPAGFLHEHRAYGATDVRIVFLARALAELLPDHPSVHVVPPLAREAILSLTGGGRDRDLDARTRLRRVIIDDVTSAPEQPLHLPTPEDDRLLAATTIVQRSPSEALPLAELGRRVGASARTLNRLFQTETGLSYVQWRTQFRVHSALLMLADGRSVTEAAAACGWANTSALIEAFTRFVGQTPGRYVQSLGRG